METANTVFTPAVTPIRIGIDVGSTTVKVVCLDENDKMIYGDYQRHRADIRNTIITVVTQALGEVEKVAQLGEKHTVSVKVTGSGGLSVSQWLNIPFIQEVVAATTAVKKLIPQTDVVIELGGEDAKITYFTGGVEQRMNGTCAGGTGAFIDQMAALLETDAPGLNKLAAGCKQIYPIAARCGVFAKTDVQPLINEGARREDIAASIFQAVVDQTISGLDNGDYAVELYANAQYTDGRGFASDLKDGATNVVYVSANDQRCYVTAHVGTAVNENGVYTVYAHVTDGTLRLGLTAEKAGTNWHTLQIKKLTLLRQGTVVYADDKTREQGSTNPQLTCTVSGAVVTGSPTLSCVASKLSAPGDYVIKIRSGSLKSDQPIYLQPGVLTVTVPSGIQHVNTQETGSNVYDLQGRKVQGVPKPGLYIRDGKVVSIENKH